MTALIKTCETVGLTWLVPFFRLARRENPDEQVRQIFINLGVPMVAILIFLGGWSYVADNVKVSFGSLPGPVAVWTEARNLWADHGTERAKEAAFYARQAERKQQYLAQNPEGTWKERRYAGKPTYLDQIFTSLKTVFTGFLIAALVAVPVGVLCGLSKVFNIAVNPFIQIFKPVSPLAWLPIVMVMVSALYNPTEPLFEKSFLSSAITVALCSLWPALINTALGVASIESDYLNVARVLKLGWATKVWKIVLPATLPLIFTGLRLSLDID
jgi:nitrate/nitrite transport system permease protein